MKVEIIDLASLEFDDAINWYEMQSRGLGNRFKKQVLEQIKKIIANPTWFLIEEKPLYKAFIPKYPFKILYTVEKNKIIIWAIAHLNRKPWYGQSRME